MQIQSSKLISFFVIISFFLHPLMLDTLSAQEEPTEYSQTQSESETDEEFDDGFSIEGPSKLRGTTIRTFGDHRIAMAFTIAGLVANVADGVVMLSWEHSEENDLSHYIIYNSTVADFIPSEETMIGTHSLPSFEHNVEEMGDHYYVVSAVDMNEN